MLLNTLLTFGICYYKLQVGDATANEKLVKLR